MPYNINEWQTGDYVTAEKLNNVESGISELDTNKEDLNNKVLEINAACTDDQYPSAKAVWNLISKVPGFDPGGGGISLQDKTITENGVFEADEGYDGLGKVTVSVSSGSGGDSEALVKMIDGTLESIENDEVEKIRDYAFWGCSSLTSGNFSMCNYICNYAFYECYSLTNVSFPICSYIGGSVFYECNSLANVSFPMCNYIGGYAFYKCFSLTNVSFPMCNRVGVGAFIFCYSLTNVSFPICSYIDSYAFYECDSLVNISFPMCGYIGGHAFESCFSLTKLNIAFSSVCSLPYSNAFALTPIAGYTEYTEGQLGSIYVPASLVDAYKSAANWSYFSDRITAIEES